MIDKTVCTTIVVMVPAAGSGRKRPGFLKIQHAVYRKKFSE